MGKCLSLNSHSRKRKGPTRCCHLGVILVSGDTGGQSIKHNTAVAIKAYIEAL